MVAVPLYSLRGRQSELRAEGGFILLLLSHRISGSLRWYMSSKADIWQGTLALMVLKTLERTGPLHGYGIARRIEQTSSQLALGWRREGNRVGLPQ